MDRQCPKPLRVSPTPPRGVLTLITVRDGTRSGAPVLKQVIGLPKAACAIRTLSLHTVGAAVGILGKASQPPQYACPAELNRRCLRNGKVGERLRRHEPSTSRISRRRVEMSWCKITHRCRGGESNPSSKAGEKGRKPRLDAPTAVTSKYEGQNNDTVFIPLYRISCQAHFALDLWRTIQYNVIEPLKGRMLRRWCFILGKQGRSPTRHPIYRTTW